MRQKKLKLSAVFLLGIGLTSIHAQEAPTATGGNALGSGGSVSYSVGQILYATNIGTDGSVVQGVQQPFEISEITGIIEAKDITLCNAYPNPTTDFLTLKIENNGKMQYNVSLYDINGKFLENKKTDGLETIISMKNLVPEIYFLKVNQGEKEIKIFKIIKK